MIKARKLRQKGFTLLELMIATMVFSTVLLLCTYGLVKIGQRYYNGVLNSRVQTAARTLSDNLIEAIQYGAGGKAPDVHGAPDNGYVCIGRGRYTYVTGAGSTQLTYDEPVTCTSPLGTAKRELLPGGLRLSRFSVVPGDGGSATISIRITSGQNDLFTSDDPVNGNCKGGSGSQFCAIASLVTVATARIQSQE